MRAMSLALVCAAFVAGSACASDLRDDFVTDRDELGENNPEDLTLRRTVRSATEGDVNMMVCLAGHLLTNGGSHDEARAIFNACVAAGYAPAMTWMSCMEDNGFGGPENPDAAAGYDRMAAEAGDPVVMFNYGLGLMRGRGVVRADAEGRRMVDDAADAGLAVARRLQGADYDLDVVTPDAATWKYQPLFCARASHRGPPVPGRPLWPALAPHFGCEGLEPAQAATGCVVDAASLDPKTS
jgi:TPR repeat protein